MEDAGWEGSRRCDRRIDGAFCKVGEVLKRLRYWDGSHCDSIATLGRSGSLTLNQMRSVVFAMRSSCCDDWDGDCLSRCGSWLIFPTVNVHQVQAPKQMMSQCG